MINNIPVSGLELDEWGTTLGFPRLENESDDDFRARLIAELDKTKLNIDKLNARLDELSSK